MEPRIPKTISLPLNLWGKIDEIKGDVPRSRFIAKLLAEGLTSSDSNTNQTN